MVYRVRRSEFESPRQVRAYLEGLRVGRLPFKFAYIGRAAHTHDRLVRSSSYGLTDVESHLVHEALAPAVVEALRARSINLVDVGSGNGCKAALLVEALAGNFPSLRYIGLDYSQTLLSIARKNLLEQHPNLDVNTRIYDFEEESLLSLSQLVRSGHPDACLFLFLGHTIGNPFAREQTVRNIAEAMQAQDILVVGSELYDAARVPEILQHYRNEAFYRAIFNPLSFCGMKRSDGLLSVSFDERTCDVLVHFVLKRDIRIIDEEHEDIVLQKGDRLLIGISHRFDMPELEQLLRLAGLGIVATLMDDRRTYALTMSRTGCSTARRS